MRIGLAVLILSMAAPAGAQIWDGGHSAERIGPRQLRPDTIQRTREVRSIDRSIREGVRRGELSRSEARELRGMAAAIGTASGGPADGIGTQQADAVLNLRGLVDARRWEGRARQGQVAGRKP